MFSIESITEKLFTGNARALSKAISLVENELPGYREILDVVIPKVGRAHRLGITGPPGAGKSTLVVGLVEQFVKKGLSVGVVAVDPSSPFTGGALLGDRIRMNQVALLEGVFIRSMASRGSLGGLAARTMDVVDILDAVGKDIAIIETVGVGQSELQIMDAADTVVVTLVPESGDAIQTMKAGLMEIAHIFVVNKADREGAEREERELKLMLELRPHDPDSWEVPVVKTIATKEEGITDLVEKINDHSTYLKKVNQDKSNLNHIEKYIIRSVIDNISKNVRGQINSDILTEAAHSVRHGTAKLSSVVQNLIEEYCRS